MKDKIKIARQLRKEQTKAEQKLWSYLRDRQCFDLKFRRQHPLKDYILDFFCHSHGIVIELDGNYHNQPQQSEKDFERDTHLRRLGYNVLRFENKMVFENIDHVFQGIKQAKNAQKAFFSRKKDEAYSYKNHLTPTLSSRRGRFQVLSTKMLNAEQESMLDDSCIAMSSYPAIKIEYTPFSIDSSIENAIFTSQHAAFALQNFSSMVTHAFCVGKKTKAALESYGFEVAETAENAAALAQCITTSYADQTFTFFCGNLRRDELPTMLKEYNIALDQVVVYETLFNKQQFQSTFDALLFFSPSGVQSFTQFNEIGEAQVFCIGHTTAKEAQKHTNHISVAEQPTVEATLDLLKNTLC